MPHYKQSVGERRNLKRVSDALQRFNDATRYSGKMKVSSHKSKRFGCCQYKMVDMGLVWCKPPLLYRPTPHAAHWAARYLPPRPHLSSSQVPICKLHIQGHPSACSSQTTLRPLPKLAHPPRVIYPSVQPCSGRMPIIGLSSPWCPDRPARLPGPLCGLLYPSNPLLTCTQPEGKSVYPLALNQCKVTVDRNAGYEIKTRAWTTAILTTQTAGI